MRFGLIGLSWNNSGVPLEHDWAICHDETGQTTLSHSSYGFRTIVP